MIPVVIPYYKKLGRLLKCKRHFNKQTMPVVMHIINDNKRNSGYTAAVNRGLRHWLAKPSEWNYIMVCDQDMYLNPDAVKLMYELMESRPKCGIAVALQQRKDLPLIVQGGGMDCYPSGCIEEAHISFFEEDKPVFWGDLACFMIRKRCLWEIGLLDENFWLVCSDSDLTLRARSMGWEVWIPAGAIGRHQKGSSHPDTYNGLSMDEIKKIPIVQKLSNDQMLFKEKWIEAGYYEYLKYEAKKPILIIKGGKLAFVDGQKDASEHWVRKDKECGPRQTKEKAQKSPSVVTG